MGISSHSLPHRTYPDFQSLITQQLLEQPHKYFIKEGAQGGYPEGAAQLSGMGFWGLLGEREDRCFLPDKCKVNTAVIGDVRPRA